QLCSDGYVIDFGMVKTTTRKVCKELNERFLCPMKSDVLLIDYNDKQLKISCQDGAEFLFPKDDCVLLPIVHSTAEELAHFIYTRLLRDFTLPFLHSRGVTDIEVAVGE
ncbi:unnamed protein product, partial [Discosporangium mesarthrocarpum]